MSVMIPDNKQENFQVLKIQTQNHQKKHQDSSVINFRLS